MSDLRNICARVGVDGSLYGLHGLRVKGYNVSLNANGENRTVVHGLWSGPKSAGRYLRLDVPNDIVPMANNMVQLHQERNGGATSEFECEDLSEHDFVDEDTFVDEDEDVVERTIHPRRKVSPAPERRRATFQRGRGASSSRTRPRMSRATSSPRPTPSAQPEAVLPNREIASDASILSFPRRITQPPQTYQP